MNKQGFVDWLAAGELFSEFTHKNRTLQMPTVDLIYDADCPNIEAARTQLRYALSQANVNAMNTTWQEWDSADPTAPARVRGYGSPTILVNGKDVAGALPAKDTSCCRVYVGQDSGLHGVPSVTDIVSALTTPTT